jgi:hypothetical protein
MNDEIKMHCSTCMYCIQGEINPQDIRRRQAFCHRRPPYPVMVPAIGPKGEPVQGLIAAWSPINLQDPNSWCGDWDDGQGEEEDDDIDAQALGEYVEKNKEH